IVATTGALPPLNALIYQLIAQLLQTTPSSFGVLVIDPFEHGARHFLAGHDIPHTIRTGHGVKVAARHATCRAGALCGGNFERSLDFALDRDPIGVGAIVG